MPLLAFWTSNPEAVGQLTVEQVVTAAGDGVLKDGSDCSREFREYLSQIPSAKIAVYIDHCLTTSFPRSGMVLQDLVNELGRRLDYSVTNGRYQGTTNAIGYDGIWASPERRALIAEVKTTDAYRISLSTIVSYRDRLLEVGGIPTPSSILIIVGREETGELEAQVRGSRHAWDIRLISADSLIKLVQLKESADGPETGRKIRSLLTPMEYTRLDQVIDVVFTTAKDVEAASVSEVVDQEASEEVATEPEKAKGTWQFTDSGLLQEKREDIIKSFGSQQGTVFVRTSRALYWDTTHETRLVCTISKRYAARASYPYWYAYHPQWDEFLREGANSFLVLGCMDLGFAFAIPWRVLHENLDGLNTTTTKDERTYWHIHLTELDPGSYAILLPKKSKTLLVEQYKVALLRLPR